jgi:hypothetical protein
MSFYMKFVIVYLNIKVWLGNFIAEFGIKFLKNSFQ